MADISPTITIITLNVNGLIVSSKRRDFQTGSKKNVFWIQFCAVYMRQIRFKDTGGGGKEKEGSRYAMQTTI